MEHPRKDLGRLIASPPRDQRKAVTLSVLDNFESMPNVREEELKVLQWFLCDLLDEILSDAGAR